MWTIYEKKTLIKTIKKLPLQIRKHYELWKRIVELEGPQGLNLIKGYRSSRLSLQWRIIYKIEQKQLEVYIIDVNPHDYR